MSDLPLISVVIPSFNQGRYIEQTIKSLLDQNYPSLEILVLDAGSTDETSEVLKRYSTHFSHLRIGPDNGQAAAINEGFRLAKGDMIAWLNSDDYLAKGALHAVAAKHRETPESIIIGDTILFQDQGTFRYRMRQSGITLENMVEAWSGALQWSQPGTFVPRKYFESVGPLDESLRFVFDLDWMCRLIQIARPVLLGRTVAFFRLHAGSKTVAEADRWVGEYIEVASRYGPLLPNYQTARCEARMRVHAGALSNLSLMRGSINQKAAREQLRQAFSASSRIVLWPKFILALWLSILPTNLLRTVSNARLKLMQRWAPPDVPG